jgi:hypothetical protein
MQSRKSTAFPAKAADTARQKPTPAVATLILFLVGQTRQCADQARLNHSTA